MNDYRIEKDSLGEAEINNAAYYGINSFRAYKNFALTEEKSNISLIRSIVRIKKASAKVNKILGYLGKDKAEAIIKSCDGILSGDYDDEFIVHPLQGGAGTSLNMNVNEVIANLAIESLGGTKGEYGIINPLDDVNLSQSTNDVFPTAMRIACIEKTRLLAERLAELQSSLQKKEEEFATVLKLGRTQLMDALPITLGQEFGAYARAISRDRWRIYKVEERLRETNLGGTAIGTGLNASLEYIYRITEEIKNETGYGLSRSDLLVDTTQNMDVFVEASGLLKACAANLIKISNDLRLMASGPKGGLGEIKMKALQQGSTIMPGKVNPVICEMVLQVSYKVISNDLAITMAAGAGQLELNAFSPLIAHSILESFELLIKAVEKFDKLCIRTLEADEERCREYLERSTSLSAVLIDILGYEKASEIAIEAFESDITIKDYLTAEGILPEDQVEKLFDGYRITNPGRSKK
ncbi:aspartate ammonia-lyase [Alkalibacter saccharofermentans]|uniref:Aspartate ammonia-lyase n=1 Tax=Alkalibacter saccharofermentans DSM 14828 TaxID=1120975 RepID=A0A1M4SCP0_9FIRM|nr:aspartate ammonia-lyase [Alkalibacter saccharofermentans]SHE29971.1 aspartate ammonia-lyase [Alkalibacter saccharofermentans DSM 14828]